MGISRDSGRLPFVAFVDWDQNDHWCDELDDLHDLHQAASKGPNGNTSQFQQTQFPYKHGWTIQHDGLTFDDIYTQVTFRKDEFIVYAGCLGDGEEYFFCAEHKPDLAAFLADFGLQLDIEKNFKVIQES